MGNIADFKIHHVLPIEMFNDSVLVEKYNTR